MKVTIDVVFKGGLGNLTATVIRDGNAVGQPVTIDKSDSIPLDDVESDDLIKLKGVSPTDGTDVTISTATLPATPRHYREGPIFSQYDVV